MCLFIFASAAALGGCTGQGEAETGSSELLPDARLGTRIGAVAKVAVPEPVAVEGYGLVGGLAGTGSGSCPPAVRAYLKRYIQTQLAARSVDADKLIDNKNTAVVVLTAVIPAASSKDDRFDVRVSLLPGSEATSLHGGWLYKAELKPRGTAAIATRPLATVDGAVFINMIGVGRPDFKEGYILGGGRVLNEYTGTVVLNRADFIAANAIRNRLDERYGTGTADAVSPTGMVLRIPPEYRWRKQRFLSMIEHTYLEQTAEQIEARLNTFIHRLAINDGKETSEFTLEALGRESLTKLGALLNASDEEVRFRAARCMLSLGDDRGFATLHQMALNPRSKHRFEALEAVSVSAKRNDAAALGTRLLRDENPTMVLAAYEQLRRLGDLAVQQEFIGRSFYLERVPQTSYRAIFIARSGEPRIVLFGAPLTCKDNIFVQSPDGSIMVSSRTGESHASVVRRLPTGHGIVGPLQTGLDVSDIVRAVGREPRPAQKGEAAGLGVPYADVAAVVEQLSAKDAVSAEFWAGPLPSLGLIIKK